MSVGLERHSDDDSTVGIPCEAAGKFELPGSFDGVPFRFANDNFAQDNRGLGT